MQRYEVLILTIPEITSDESSTIEKEFEKTVQDAGGSLLSYERWGKLRLAYPINKNDYGVYFLSRFEVANDKKVDLLQNIRSLFTVKYNNLISRYMACVLDPKASLDYQRPESLEDVPTRDVGQFLRENKMEGLLSRVDAPQEQAAAAPSKETVETQEAEASA